MVINTDVIDNDGLIRLIEVQRNPRYFEWRNELRGFDPYYENEYDDVFSNTFLAVEEKADTLDHLIMVFQDFEGCDTYLPVPIDLLKFHRLKTLRIIAPSYQVDEQLVKTSFQDLEVFHAKSPSYETIDSIIKKSGGRFGF